MTNYYLYFIVVFFIVATIFVISFYLFRLSSMLKKQKRLTRFSITTNTQEKKSIFEVFEDIYANIIKKMSKTLKKSEVIAKYGKGYDKYIDLNSPYFKEGIDLVSNKIVFGLFCVMIAIAIDGLRFQKVTFVQIFISFLFGYCFVNVYLYIKRKKEEKQISNDLLKAVSIMNNAFKSGRSIMQAVDIVSRELDGPISNEFKKMYLDLSYGLELNVVFDRFSKRVNNDEIKYMAASLVILNKTGGNIVKVFKTIEKGFFDRRKLQDELNSSLALSNLVYKVLIILPVIMVLVIYLLNPNYFIPLLTTTIGKLVLVIILVIYITYIFVVKKITELKE